MKPWTRWWLVAVFAAAMAWMESATVVYLRTLFARIEPHQARPLPMADHLSGVELIREAATIIMLVTMGGLAGSTWRSRFGFFALAFGIWDIFYYIFLNLICGWPKSLFDWDILFLIPLPWWGPVLSPMLIAALMVFGGTLIGVFDRPGAPIWPRKRTMALSCLSVGLALYVFMTDAIREMSHGREAVRNFLPQFFNWPLFGIALVLMVVPAAELAHQALLGTRVGRSKIK